MKKQVFPNVVVYLLCCMAVAVTAWTDPTPTTDSKDVTQQLMDLQRKVEAIEQKIGSGADQDPHPLLPVVAGLQFTGGISAGSFYASQPGPDASNNQFLLSNFLVELSPVDQNQPVGFTGAFGETSTPSVLSVPENNTALDIEYASLTLMPITGTSVEVGLLQPNAGFENTYTFNNVNAMLGAVASQQPYNAYGARFGYDIQDVHVCAGYYKKRLDQDEYNDRGYEPGDSWEIGLGGSILDNTFSLYHYQLEAQRRLTGVVVERTLGNVSLAANVDYWRWNASMDDGRDKTAVGFAVYAAPTFGSFSVPVRLEYIDQGKSLIYIEEPDAKRIYTMTVSPTYRYGDHAYVRLEAAYAHADHGFADTDGNPESKRVCATAEVGYLF